MKRDTDMQTRVIAAVKDIENASSMEVVVTLSPRSTPATMPILASALAICITLLSVYPLLFAAATAVTVTMNILIITAIMTLLVGSLPPLQRLFFSGRYLQEKVLTAARAEFVRQGIHSTRQRTGLLLYLSAFERHAVLVVDLGVRSKIPAAAMEELEAAATAIFSTKETASGITAFLEQLRLVAGRYLPKEADDVNELDDGLRCL
jgi:putative membrane protein